jgi:hypothetical protein
VPVRKGIHPVFGKRTTLVNEYTNMRREQPFTWWVNSISQDDYGFVGLRTDDGLYGHNEDTFKPYRNGPKNHCRLSDNTVKIVFEDRAAILWIGAQYEGLDSLDPTRDDFTRSSHDPSPNVGAQTERCDNLAGCGDIGPLIQRISEHNAGLGSELARLAADSASTQFGMHSKFAVQTRH